MTGPSRVRFHIGIGKTGSSYLQAALAAGRDVLAAHGIAYPMEPQVAEQALAGGITSGNLRAAEDIAETMARYPEAQAETGLLFSNETLHLVLTAPNRAYPEGLRAQFPDARLEFLCYIRDPLDHAMSAYQQAVKRGGYTRDCADFLKTYDRPIRLLELDETIRGIGGTLTLLNYSRHRDDLLATFEHWLGLAPGALPVPARPQINRSLTRAELALQRALNARLGPRAAKLAADPLCEGLPDVASELPEVPPDDLAAFVTRMDRMLADPRLLALIPEPERLRIGRFEEIAPRFAGPGAAEGYTFTAEQLDMLAEGIASVLPKRGPQPGPAGRQLG